MQQRPLALLALLAVAGRTGSSRDKLIGYLWPDSDAEHARHRLADVVYVLRKALGEDAIVASGETLLLNPSIVQSDVGALLDSLAARDLESAVERYPGPLLDGFAVSGAADFERWVDRERQALGDSYANALHSLAAAAAAADDRVAAVKWWRRLLAHDPYNSRVALSFIESLVAFGDPANARLVVQEHERVLREELEVEPSADFRESAEQVIERGVGRPLEATSDEAHPRRALQPSATGGPPAAPRPRTRFMLVPALVLGALVVAIGVRQWLRPPTGNPGRLMSVAVLPLDNLSPGADDDYLAEGVHDEIINQLGRIAALKVISRTSVMGYRGSATPVTAIAAELRVTHIIEGAVRRIGDRVRITIQLIDAGEDAQIWGETYDRQLSDLFAIQRDVAQQVATALEARLSPEEAARVERQPTTNLEAYDFYLRGNAHINRGFDEELVRIAIRMYEDAVRLDPQFALAWARLAKAHSWMYWLYYDHTTERLARATEAVEQARRLDPEHFEVALAQAWYYYHGHLDYDRALEQLAIVRRRQPNHSESLALMHYIQRRQGEFEAAASNVRQALDLDPRNGLLHDQASQTFRLMRDYPAAQHHVERAILLEPSSATGYLDGIRLHLKWTGNVALAREFLEKAQHAGAADNEFLRHSAVLLHLLDGRLEDALAQLRADPGAGYSIYPYFVPKAQMIAQAYGLLGDRERERVYYDSARITTETRSRVTPDDDRLLSALGIALAGLGRKGEAVRMGKRAIELMPIETEAWRGSVRLEDLARIHTMVGDYDAALDQLDYLLSIPSTVSVALLGLDPSWAPLRGHPRFTVLLAKYRGP